MKKYFPLILCLALLISLSACSRKGPDVEPTLEPDDISSNVSENEDNYTEAESLALTQFAALYDAIRADDSGFFSAVSIGTDAYKAIVEIEDLYHANADSEIITQLYYVAETVSALQTSALLGDSDLKEQAKVYAACIDKSYTGPYADEICAFVDDFTAEAGEVDESQEKFMLMTKADKAIVIDFIEQRYEYYDLLAGEYTGDKNNDRIWAEAAAVFGLTEAQVDIIWFDQDIWSLYRTGKYKFTGISEPEVCVLDAVDISTLDGVYSGEIASVTYRKSEEFSDVASIYQYNEDGQLVREVGANGNNLFDTTYEYYNDGQVLSETIYWYEVDNDGTLTQNKTAAHTYEYTYDDAGNLTLARHVHTKGDVTNEEIREYIYSDGILQEVVLSTNGTLESVSTYTYDTSSLLILVVAQNELTSATVETTYAYDSEGRTTKETRLVTHPNSVKEYTTTYLYNSDGLLIEMCETSSARDYSNITTYEYDSDGRVIREIISHDEKYATSYAYSYYDLGVSK